MVPLQNRNLETACLLIRSEMWILRNADLTGIDFSRSSMKSCRFNDSKFNRM